MASGFIAARTTSSSPVVMPPSVPPASVLSRRYAVGLGVPADRVVGGAAAPPGDLEPVADLDALDRLDAHHRLGQQRVELAIPVHVAAETDRYAEAEHLDHAAERVAVLGGGLDLGDHRLGRAGSKQRTGESSTVVEVVGRRARRPDADRAEPIWITCEMIVDAEVAEQLLRHRAGRHARRGLAGAGPLEHIAGVGEAVLLHPGEIGVSGPDLGERRLGRAPAPATSRRCHLSLRNHSVFLISIATGEPSVRPCRTPPTSVSSSSSNRWRGPRPYPSRRRAISAWISSTVISSPAGRPSIDDHERLPVRLAGGEETEHPGEVIRGAVSELAPRVADRITSRVGAFARSTARAAGRPDGRASPSPSIAERSGIARRSQQRRLERVVDEIGDDLLGDGAAPGRTAARRCPSRPSVALTTMSASADVVERLRSGPAARARPPGARGRRCD